MTQYTHIGAPPPPPAPRKSGMGTGAVLGIAAAALAVGLGIGCLGGIMVAGSPTPAKSTNTVAEKPAANTNTTTAPPPAPTSAAPPPGPASTIEDGTWTVGVDILPGTYRPREAAGPTCYWKITKSGTNGDDIVQNSIGGGRPTVTLKVGQDFTTHRCGVWAKQ